MNIFKHFLTDLKSIMFYIFDSMVLLKPPSLQKNKLEIILLIRQDAIGDFIIWLDTAKEYRKIFPSDKYKIVLVGNKIWCNLAQELPYWDDILTIDVKKFKTLSNYRWKLLCQIRNLNANIAIQPTYSREFYNGDSLVRASNALRKISSIGDMNNRNWLKRCIADSWHTELIPSSTEPLTELERNAEFFSNFSDDTHYIRYPKLEIKDFLLFPKSKDKKYYVLVPGTSQTTIGREWPTGFFANLATKIFQKTGWIGVICGTKHEHLLGEQILNLSEAPLKNICGHTTLAELAGLLNKSRLTISNETGIVFISSSVGTPSICILGGGHFGRFVPYPDLQKQNNNLKEVFHKMPCYGCNWNCIYPILEGEATPCISNISVDSVWEKVKPLLTS